MRGLLWSSDNETGGLSPIPASPLLLPAFGIYAALAVSKVFYDYARSFKPKPEGFSRSEYEYNKEREAYLIHKKYTLGEELTTAELYELREVLPYPSWSNGERWTYY